MLTTHSDAIVTTGPTGPAPAGGLRLPQVSARSVRLPNVRFRLTIILVPVIAVGTLTTIVCRVRTHRHEAAIVRFERRAERRSRQERAIARIQEVAERYGLELVTEKERSPVLGQESIWWRSASRGAIAYFAPVLGAELEVYPETFIGKMRLRRLVLCANLVVAGDERAAAPALVEKTLYLDVNSATYDRKYQRRVIHHELFHFLDFADDSPVVPAAT